MAPVSQKPQSVASAAIAATALAATLSTARAFVPTHTAGPAPSSSSSNPPAAAGAGPIDLTVAAVRPGSSGAATCAGAAVAAACIGALAVRASSRRSAPTNRGPRTVNVAAAAEEGEAGEWMGAEKFSKLTESVPNKFDHVAISKILPHRYPFALVDKVVEFEAGKRAVGVKNITANEPQFTGHFPDRPIMPGVLMVEAMAQLGGIVALQEPVSDGKGQFFFAGIDGIKFRRPVVPGDTLVMEMELKKWRAKYGIAKMAGKAYVDGQLALEVKEFTFALVKEES